MNNFKILYFAINKDNNYCKLKIDTLFVSVSDSFYFPRKQSEFSEFDGLGHCNALYNARVAVSRVIYKYYS